MASVSMLMLGVVAAVARANTGECNSVELDFVVLAGEASHKAIEDDIRADLAEVGVNAVVRFLEKEDFNAAMVSGDYDLVFSETWGAPYDPHSYVASWPTPDEAHYSVLQTMDPPLDPTTFEAWVANVSAEVDPVQRQATWTEILSAIHAEYIHLPLWGKRIPSVISRRLQGYIPGPQQFDYPIANIRVVEGSKNVTVAPGAQTGLFQSVGRLDPHSYRPNEFFSNNWVYEGLVAYGRDGNIEASLAKSWSSTVRSDGGESVRFTLREGVTFHDGSEFNCTVVKLNFDHVFAPPLRGPDWHGWYGLPGSLSNWYCDGNDFILETSEPYYPLLQELTYIRPMRILSPAAFAQGIFTSPETHNSCPASWGTVVGDDGSEVNCVGVQGASGTGPFVFVSRSTNVDGMDDLVVFKHNADYWGGVPDIEFVHVVLYETHADVKAALLAGELDAVIGAGVLEPSDVQELQYSVDFDVAHTEPTQNTVIIMNIDDINIRKVVVHAVNKGPIIERELGGIEEPVSQLFPESAPYCDVDLVPKFDYDLEKALLLNCPEDSSKSKKSKSNARATVYIALFVAAAAVAMFLVLCVCYMVRRERVGEPLFTPLTNPLIDDEVYLGGPSKDTAGKAEETADLREVELAGDKN